jgi:hypothetical protein
MDQATSETHQNVKPDRMKKAREVLARKRAEASLIKTNEMLQILKKRQEEAQEALKAEKLEPETQIPIIVEPVIEPEPVIQEETPVEIVKETIQPPVENVQEEKKTEENNMSTEEDIEIKPVKKQSKKKTKKSQKKRDRKQLKSKQDSENDDEMLDIVDEESSESEKPKKKKRKIDIPAYNGPNISQIKDQVVSTIRNIEVPPVVVDTLKSTANSALVAMAVASLVVLRGYIQSRLLLPPTQGPPVSIPRPSVTTIVPTPSRNNFPPVNTASLFY